ncbi:hypothetical protein ACFVIM_18365 [Streptomyces sp. NPDC057638]|uniref:hypothetical protein n=1 Tax=Streptomyces sp. NPDC057638 TaxID=3346190 RepID=UPI0036BD0B8D
MAVPLPRRLVGVAAVTLLALGATGCSGLGRTAVGPVTWETPQEHAIMVNSPLVTGCHSLGPGAVAVENGTLVDLVLYRTPRCTGGDTIYLPTTTSDQIAPGSGPWRSYTLVH